MHRLYQSLYVKGCLTIFIPLRTSYISILRHDFQLLFISTMMTLTTQQPSRIFLAIFAFQKFKIFPSVLHSCMFLVSTSGSSQHGMDWVGCVRSYDHFSISQQASKQRIFGTCFFSLQIFLGGHSVFLLSLFTFWCGCGYSMRRWRIPKKVHGFWTFVYPLKRKSLRAKRVGGSEKKTGMFLVCVSR